MAAHQSNHREKDIFERALDLECSEERLGYIRGACADDAALLARVQALLRAHDEASRFLPDAPGADVEQTCAIHPSAHATPGDRIGRYKLFQKIGEGGCGVVYMAEQEEPVRRRVALKVIKLGMDTKSVIARFEAERQALALMDHPNIAKVLDAGATDEGRPYFVMELVRGTKITEYCDQLNVPTRDRLELFVKVCQAIQHAHQKGIIHRDIKPSNILVTLHDGVPVPKVIDFGIAKATTDQHLTDKTIFTALEQFIGTPAYMSPEQAEMSGLDIDTRCDIYSLGVLLYELLTGKTPFDVKELLASGLDEMRRTIREKEPLRPSTKLSQTLIAAAEEVGRAAPRARSPSEDTATGGAHGVTRPTPKSEEEVRASSHRLLRLKETITLLRGDVDWIVMKCLEKDRARRYETASGLASDIQRYLNNEAVLARPPSAAYRFQKLVRRNKLSFAAAAGIASVLLLGTVISTWQAIRATHAEGEQSRLLQQAQMARANESREREKAQTEAARSQQVAQFLKDMLEGVAPSVALGRDATMLREILDKTAERIGEDLKDQPAVEAELRSTVGKTYFELGAYAKAEAMQREALRIRQALHGETNELVAASMNDLANILEERRDFVGAEALHRQALAIRRQLLGTIHPDIAVSLSGVASALIMQDRYPECEPVRREALAMYRELFGNEHPDAIESLIGLANVLWLQRKATEAETVEREALALVGKLPGQGNPTLATSLRALGLLFEKQGRLVEAETMTREALKMRSTLLGEHPYVASALNGLGRLLRKQGKLAEAETYFRQGLSMYKKFASYESKGVVESFDFLAGVLRQQGKPAEAQAVYDEQLQWLRQTNDPKLADALATRTANLLAEGKFTEAEPLARESLTIREQKVPDDWLTCNSRSMLGGCFLGQEKYAEAEPLLLSGYEGLKQREDKIPATDRLHLMEAIARLVALSEVTGKSDKATLWKSESTQLYRNETARRRAAAEDGDVGALTGLAWLLATCEDPAIRDGPGAVTFAQRAAAATDRKEPAILDTLSAAYAEAGRFREAVSVQRAAIALLQDETLKKDFGARLKLYEAKTPYRQRFMGWSPEIGGNWKL